MWRPFTISIVSKLSYSTPWTHMQGVKWSVHLSLFTVSLQYGKGRQMVKSKEYSMALAWTTIRLHTLFAYIILCIHSPQLGLSVIVLVFGDFAVPVYPCLNQPQHLQRQRETEGKFSTVLHSNTTLKDKHHLCDKSSVSKSAPCNIRCQFHIKN